MGGCQTDPHNHHRSACRAMRGAMKSFPKKHSNPKTSMQDLKTHLCLSIFMFSAIMSKLDLLTSGSPPHTTEIDFFGLF